MKHPENPTSGIVYSETIVYTAPTRFADETPYQLAIIDLLDKRRLTVRIAAESPSEFVTIGDRAVFVEEREGVFFYRRSS